MDSVEFKKRYLKQHKLLYRISWSLTQNVQDAEDLVQDTYLRLWQKRDILPPESETDAYLITVVKNLFYDRQRKMQVDARADIDKVSEMIKDDLFVEHTLYNGNYYGSTKDQIADNKSVVIDLEGLKSYSALNNKRIVTFYLSTSEEVRFKRMLERGDSKENAEQRIKNDRKSFADNQIPPVDFKIDSENKTIEQVADEIYRLYCKKMKAISNS